MFFICFVSVDHFYYLYVLCCYYSVGYFLICLFVHVLWVTVTTCRDDPLSQLAELVITSQSFTLLSTPFLVIVWGKSAAQIDHPITDVMIAWTCDFFFFYSFRTLIPSRPPLSSHHFASLFNRLRAGQKRTCPRVVRTWALSGTKEKPRTVYEINPLIPMASFECLVCLFLG